MKTNYEIGDRFYFPFNGECVTLVQENFDDPGHWWALDSTKTEHYYWPYELVSDESEIDDKYTGFLIRDDKHLLSMRIKYGH